MITDAGNSSPDQSRVLETPGKSAAADAGLAAIQAATEGTRRRRGRPRKDAQDIGGTGAIESASAKMSPELQAAIAQQLEYCYDPKAWGSLLGLPAHMMLAKTGHKHWNLAKEETETLGACGSVAARFLMIASPKTLAGMMVASALFAVYVPRAIEEMKIRRDEKEKKPETKA